MIKSEKEKLILASCCGPCSTAILDELREKFEILLLFWGSNLSDEKEFDKRVESQEKVCKYYGIKYVILPYKHKEFLKNVKNLENCNEGEERCLSCFKQRFEHAAKFALSTDVKLIGTTLSISPYKNYNNIILVGESVANENGLTFLNNNFSEKFNLSNKISKELNIYKQNYCGCEFSKQKYKNEN